METTNDFNVFITYSQEDRPWLDRLLGFLRQQPGVRPWHDGLIGPGDNFHSKIVHAIESAHVSICLLSQSFLTSHFCQSEEIPRLLKNGIKIIPVNLNTPTGAINGVKWLDTLAIKPSHDRDLASLPTASQDRVLHQIAQSAASELAPSSLKDFILGLDQPQWGGGDNILVYAGLDFPSYTHFIESMVDRLGAAEETSS